MCVYIYIYIYIYTTTTHIFVFKTLSDADLGRPRQTPARDPAVRGRPARCARLETSPMAFESGRRAKGGGSGPWHVVYSPCDPQTLKSAGPHILRPLRPQILHPRKSSNL